MKFNRLLKREAFIKSELMNPPAKSASLVSIEIRQSMCEIIATEARPEDSYDLATNVKIHTIMQEYEVICHSSRRR